jgi:hypothetical protein
MPYLAGRLKWVTASGGTHKVEQCTGYIKRSTSETPKKTRLSANSSRAGKVSATKVADIFFMALEDYP